MLDPRQFETVGPNQPSRLNPTLRRLLALLRMDRNWERAEGVWLVEKEEAKGW